MKRLSFTKETVSHLRVRVGIRTGRGTGIDLSLRATCQTLNDACRTNACASDLILICASVGCQKQA